MFWEINGKIFSAYYLLGYVCPASILHHRNAVRLCGHFLHGHLSFHQEPVDTLYCDHVTTIALY